MGSWGLEKKLEGRTWGGTEHICILWTDPRERRANSWRGDNGKLFVKEKGTDLELRWGIWAGLREGPPPSLYQVGRKKQIQVQGGLHEWVKKMRMSSFFSPHLHLDFLRCTVSKHFPSAVFCPYVLGRSVQNREKAASGGGGCNPRWRWAKTCWSHTTN